MSVTPSQFPPEAECPPQSRYKSLIADITSKKSNLKIPVYIQPFVNAINVHINQLVVYTYWDF
ncbi:unnamed protein product, partial [Staurois parvus]